MSDLNFKHGVEQRPAVPELPEYKRAERVQSPSGVPDVQSAAQSYAENTNWLSAVGSAVATKASNAIAQKMGSEAGKNPHGELLPSFTDFDKTYAESYKTQAHATLGLQANKLITDSNLEMAKAPRLSPELISRTQQQVSIGLQNIFANAPAEIRPNLEYQYGTQQLNQASELTERMLREQKEDRKANTAYSSQVNAENAHRSAMSGDYKAAESFVESTRRNNEADVAAGISTKLMAKTNIDAARLSALSGKYSHEYDVARSQGKGEEYLRNLADKKPSDISDADYPTVVSQVMQHVQQQQTLRHQDQALAIAKFNVSLAENPLGITNSQIIETNSHLEPVQQEQLSLAYVQAIKRIKSGNDAVAEALSVYTDINKFPLQSSDAKNGAWEATYQSMLKKPENIATGMTEDTAKLYAAAAAPVAIPAFITELNAKASTANPAMLETAGQAVDYMQSHNLGYNLSGLGEQQKAMLETYGQLRGILPPQDAAQKAHEVVYNKSKAQQEANDLALAQFYKSQKMKNATGWSFISKLMDIPENVKIRNFPGYMQKSTQLFESYFKITNGDEATAQKLAKQDMNTQYGTSLVNNEPELTFHPIESIPGIPHDAIGPIQSDIVEQANSMFAKQKPLFDEGKIPFWYEARQRITPDEVMTSRKIVDAIYNGYTKHPITGAIFDVEGKRKELLHHERIIDQYKNGNPITIVKHNLNGKDEFFEGAVQANPWGKATGNPNQPVAGGYDLMMKTANGVQNIIMTDPLNTRVMYNPRVDYIRNIYVKTIGFSLVDRYMPHNLRKTGIALPLITAVSQKVGK